MSEVVLSGSRPEWAREFDEVAAEIRHDAERAGSWEGTHLWVVSDHGHSPVREHEDLVRVVRSFGHHAMAHPWVYRLRPEVAVMVSGNAMAHLYLDLQSRERPWWPQLGARWRPLVDGLLERPSVDIALLPESPTRCGVVARGRGRAVVTLDRGADGRPRYSYLPCDGDPLGAGEVRNATADEAYDATVDGDYPDSIVQIAHLAGAARAGEIVLSASREWDFRARWEPIPHLSSHGALHREHMLVPLVVNHPVAGRPRRTVDVMPSALTALGVAVPPGLDGESFV
ncbi:MAG: hypothetical protein HOQ09_13670 [Gemmatimonadaceae bacterium]|nr:hypothetical protein [Gemmatimonadaceae bacterium]